MAVTGAARGQRSATRRRGLALGVERYAEAFARGRQMTLDEAVALTVRIQDEVWGPGDPQ